MLGDTFSIIGLLGDDAIPGRLAYMLLGLARAGRRIVASLGARMRRGCREIAFCPSNIDGDVVARACDLID